MKSVTAARVAAVVTLGAAAALLVIASIGTHQAAMSWRARTLVGCGADASSLVWSSDHAAWVNPGGIDGGAPGSVIIWDSPTETTSVLIDMRATDWVNGLDWYKGSLYWQRVDSETNGGFDILSMAPGDREPRVVLHRNSDSEGLFDMVEGRMIWTEWLPGKQAWDVYTMTLSNPTPKKVQRFVGTEEDDFSSADIRLSSKALAWAELLSGDSVVGDRVIHVIPIEEQERLGTEIVVGAKGSYLSDTLQADGARLVWVVEESAGTRIYSWSLGDNQPQAVPGSFMSQGDELGDSVICTALSGDRVAWTAEAPGEGGPGSTTVKTWAVGEPTATKLAFYPFRPSGTVVSRPAVSSDRVVWAAARCEDNLEDAESDDVPLPEPDGAIVTWEAGDASPQVVAKQHLPIWASTAAPTVSGERIAFGVETEDEYDFTQAVWIAEAGDLERRTFPWAGALVLLAVGAALVGGWMAVYGRAHRNSEERGSSTGPA